MKFFNKIISLLLILTLLVTGDSFVALGAEKESSSETRPAVTAKQKAGKKMLKNQESKSR